jgi:hypothetical protein
MINLQLFQLNKKELHKYKNIIMMLNKQRVKMIIVVVIGEVIRITIVIVGLIQMMIAGVDVMMHM